MNSETNREQRYREITNGYERGDILKYDFDPTGKWGDEFPIQFFKILSVKYWEDYGEATLFLEDIETGEKCEKSAQLSGFSLHQKNTSRFAWVQEKGQNGWVYKDISNEIQLEYVGDWDNQGHSVPYSSERFKKNFE